MQWTWYTDTGAICSCEFKILCASFKVGLKSGSTMILKTLLQCKLLNCHDDIDLGFKHCKFEMAA